MDVTDGFAEQGMQVIEIIAGGRVQETGEHALARLAYQEVI